MRVETAGSEKRKNLYEILAQDTNQEAKPTISYFNYFFLFI